MNLALHPLLLFPLSLVVLGLSAWTGAVYRSRHRALEGEAQQDFSLVIGATLTLLGLIIGFTFSMALTRYDLRKNYEEAEANAVGTEYLRAELLPLADAAKVRALLLAYTEQRILWYTTDDMAKLQKINDRTATLEAELWSAVRIPALEQPTPVAALAVAGMNDVLNSQGYTQAAWWNRIPPAAWILMAAMAICATGMIGFVTGKSGALWVMPVVVSLAFFLIADIDTPRRGVIRVIPQNLLSLAESLRAQPSSPATAPR